MNSGPIVIIEDDPDDRYVFEEVLKELNLSNKLISFSTATDAWNYLQTTSDSPFIIFSDINLPKQNGIEFKKQIDADEYLRKKCIPFIFYSTSVNQYAVNEAYTQITIQGYFQKCYSYEETKTTLKLIFDYWTVCVHPVITRD